MYQRVLVSAGETFSDVAARLQIPLPKGAGFYRLSKVRNTNHAAS
jgi:hypothetical protein